ncbi:GPP34 family phosphoprotein [Streptomyces albus]|uniref:GOLPH3/VPS74 family protein n=1 Tax=Streptomyces albus TaxID=1888 RepID=UPI00068DD020|nr:GPP34 family phosphoprotein [Streptomyces albus]
MTPVTHGSRSPRSLAARLCLLAHDPGTGRPGSGGPEDGPDGVDRADRPAPLVRAGALTELARRGLLTDDGGVVTPDLDARTGDPALDDLLELITESPPHGWRDWVTRHAGTTLDAVQAGLADEGALRVVSRRWLGLLPPRDYALVDRDAARALRARARQVLRGREPAARVAPEDAALAVLAATAGLTGVAPARDRSAPERRIAELTRRAGQCGPAGGPAAVTPVRAVAEVRAGLAAAVADLTEEAAVASAAGG